MSYTSNLKKTVDLPVWELLNQAPTASSALSSWTTVETGDSKYIYYLAGALFYRYDIDGDAWQQLATPNVAPLTVASLRVTMNRGFHGRVLGATSTSVTIPGLRGKIFDGKKLRILQGTGAGQERTLTYTGETTHDFGVMTAGTGSTNITDGLKKWKINQWAGYQIGITFGSGQSVYKKVLYNDATTLYFNDVNLQPHDPWNNQAIVANAPYALANANVNTQAHYRIFSSTYSVTAWTVTPDLSSFFTTLTGGIYLASSSSAAPFISLQYYDIANDNWQTKTVPQGLILAAYGTDISIERTGKFGTAFLSGTATLGSSRTLVTGLSLVPNRYRNYRMLITGGTGVGQNLRIVSHTANTFNFGKAWTTIPDGTSTFEIWADYDKLYIAGNAASAIYAYSPENDLWLEGHSFDDGITTNMSVQLNGWIPFGISTGTRLAAGVTAVASAPTAGGTNYSLGDVLTCSVGGAGAQVIVTGITTGGVVTAIELQNAGTATGYTVATGQATTGGTGTGCTISITSVGPVCKVVTATSNFFERGDNITISGCTETPYNVSTTVLCANGITSFDITTSATANMAPSLTQTTTQIIDSSKNWIVNEHVGRIVSLVTAGTGGTAQKRWITSNTASSLTVATIVAGVNGTSKYVIQDSKVFGVDEQYKQIDKCRDGFATGGTTATLVDSTKNWFINQWAGYKVRIEAGPGLGSGIIAIISNTANTLTYATQTFTPTAATFYEIADTWGLMTAGSASSVTETGTKNWAVNAFGGKRLRVTAGTGLGQEVTIASNTSTVLTTGSMTAPDATSTYAILGIPQRGAGIQLLWLWGTSDSANNGKYMLVPRGGASHMFDIYDLTTGTWNYGLFFSPQQETYTTGSMYAYDGVDTIYLHKDGTGRIFSLNFVTGEIRGAFQLTDLHSTATVGNRMEVVKSVDGVPYLYLMQHTGTKAYRTLIF